LLAGNKKDTGKMIVRKNSKQIQTKIVEQLEDIIETLERWSQNICIFWENKMANVESHAEGGGPTRAPNGRILGGGDERRLENLEQRRAR
jgi:hypothetical protein